MKYFRQILLILVFSASMFCLANFWTHTDSFLNFAPQTAHAVSDQQLHDDLVQSTSTEGWIFSVWKTFLGIANAFVVLVLIFLAIVNVMHIQYDTYAIKKALPLLIIGVIMANFSMFIVRMFVDVAQVITNTFIGQNTHDFVSGLLCSVAVKMEGGFGSGMTGDLSLILIIVFGLLILIGILIAAFLLWIRFVVIYALAACAPLAFIMLAFPMTQTIFKKWWGWFTQWVFLAPIMMFVFWMASRVGQDNCGNEFSVTKMLLSLALVYIGCLVPFKMGGAVMSAWSGAGKKMASPATKAAGEWWSRRKEKAGAMTRAKFPRIFAGAQKDREEIEALKKVAEGRVRQKARKSGTISQLEHAAKTEEDNLQGMINEQMRDILGGEMPMGVLMRLSLLGIKWEGGKPRLKDETDLATEGIQAAAKLALTQKDLDKYREDTTNLAALKIGKEDSELKAILEKMKSEGHGIKLQHMVDGELQDEMETVKDEATGETITRPKLGTYSDVLQRATEYGMRASIEKDPALKRKYLQAAQQMRQEAQTFAKANPTYMGQKVNYKAWMDKGYAGRVLSLTTNWLKEDSQVEAMNTPPDELIKSIFEGGAGDRNIRTQSERIQRAIRGERTSLDVSDLRAYVRLCDAIQIDASRGSNADRATTIGELLQQFAKAQHEGQKGLLGQDSYQGGNRLGEELLNYATTISENPALLRGSLAEQILAARHRGQTLAGTEELLAGMPKNPRDWTKESIAKHIEDSSFDVLAHFVAHPELINQFGTVAVGISTRDSNTLLNLMADGIGRLKILGAGGNPMLNITAGSDIAESDWFKPLKVKRENIGARRVEVDEREAERARVHQQTTEMASQDPTAYREQVEQGVVRGSDPMRLMQSHLQAITQLLARQTALLSGIRVGGQGLDDSMTQRVSDLISGATAENLEQLQAAVRAQVPDIEINLPDGYTNDRDGIARFQQDVRASNNGVQNARTIVQAAEAQQASQYAPVGQNKTLERLNEELEQMSRAVGAFEQAARELAAQGRTVPREGYDGIVKEVSDKAPLTPLTKQILQENPAQALEILRKMLIGWQGAISAKQRGQDLNQQSVLQGIFRVLRDQNALLNFPRRRAGTPGPAPAAPAQPNPPATPPAPEEDEENGEAG